MVVLIVVLVLLAALIALVLVRTAKFNEYVKSVYPVLEIKSAAKESKKSVLREACGAVTAPSAAAAQGRL